MLWQKCIVSSIKKYFTQTKDRNEFWFHFHNKIVMHENSFSSIPKKKKNTILFTHIHVRYIIIDIQLELIKATPLYVLLNFVFLFRSLFNRTISKCLIETVEPSNFFFLVLLLSRYFLFSIVVMAPCFVRHKGFYLSINELCYCSCVCRSTLNCMLNEKKKKKVLHNFPKLQL